MVKKTILIKKTDSDVNNILKDTYYPDMEDPDFLKKVVTKREFWKTRIRLKPTTMEKQCQSDKPFQLLPQQEFLKNFINVDTPYSGILIYHGVGVGKCHAKDTPIIMYNGSTKLVQDIKEGELIMGDDSSARRVMSLARGRDIMYKIIPSDGGDIFTVNQEHILVLKNHRGKIKEMSVVEYCRLPVNIQNQLVLYRAAVIFMGNNPVLEITHELINKFDILTGIIPNEILVSSLTNRKKYIGMLLRKIGIKYADHYRVVFKTYIAMHHIKFLARSCGYGAFDFFKNYTHQSGFTELFGDFHPGMPVYVPTTPFRCIDVMEDDYYGFTLDGNCRYLLGDFLVTHNTCSAIQIAKGFKNVLRRIHGGSENRKILVLIPGDKLKDNFKRELFNHTKAFRSKSKLSTEQILSMEGETRQCTGSTYEIPVAESRLLDARRIERRIDRMVRNDYRFVNHQKFASDVILLIGGNWDLKLKSLTDLQKEKINKHFRNRIIIVDEIHNIRSNDNNRVAPVLDAVIRYADNIRLVMLTATPMVDDPREIIYLINLLLLNDRRQEIVQNGIFDKFGNFLPGGAELLQKASIGYVSYLRGARPDTFPLRIEPNNTKFINGTFDWKGVQLHNDEKMHRQKLMPVEMSLEHYETYQIAWKKYMETVATNNADEILVEEGSDFEDETNVEGDDESVKDGKKYLPFISLSNIWIPVDNNNGYATKKDEAYSAKIKENVAFQLLQRTDPRTKKRFHQISYQNLAIINRGTREETSILNENHLPKYSTKYSRVLELTRQSRGTVMIYSSYIWFGVYPMAMVLEQNGFQRYIETGDQPLLNYPRNHLGGGGISEPICAYCSKTRKNGKHVLLKEAHKLKPEEYPGDHLHVFKQARYIIVTGGTLFESLRSVFTQSENRWGGEIKVIIGSSAIAEGINLFNIRQTHILEPRYNWSKIEQIIGRATRTCSHIELPQKDRTIEVFLWVSVAPLTANKTEQNTELVNYRYYRKAEIKDRKIKAVEYILKIAAVDCYLNKDGNLFLSENMENWLGFKNGNLQIQNSLGQYKTITIGDEPYSRTCEYRPTCEYRCAWEPDPNNNALTITTDTYTLQHSRSTIDETKREIRRLYLHSPAYTLEGIEQALLSKFPTVERPILYQALEEFLVRGKEYLSDPYHRKGYLIYRGKFYVWQPLEINDESIPIYYRRIPLQTKIRSVIMPLHYNKPNNDENAEEENDVKIVDLVTGVIKHAQKMLESWAFVYDTAKKHQCLILVSMVLDRLPSYREHFLVIQQIYIISITKKIFDDPWLESIVKYYDRIWLEDFTDKKVASGFYWENKFYSWDSKKNELVHIGLTNSTNTITHNYHKRQELFGPLGIVSESEVVQSGRIWRENVPRNVIFGFMEFFRKKEWLFKIVDKTRETGEQTQKVKDSKRSESRGKKCANYSLKDLREIMEKLDAKLVSSSIVTLCNAIEYNLRWKDIRSKKTRWMLTSLEVLLAN